MATSVRKKIQARFTRDEMVQMLDLPSPAFRVAKAKMTEAELNELRIVWQEISAEAVADYNRYVEQRGLPLAKYRMF